ncbi:hypothetical protein HETIRDRAFT_108448 [Heterobasidion irregulare TC 32-1]|uniref:Uncharacterized protein n=1 Tax=Heterobasidion irregulare (strain TC 32-1) TaxID=747525 RepID=W4JN07_HETIT|nr:uncharacterized protein HETIRDRAFT_108448 [Heterobasidion irregulare TC 32-1]ETW74849.1 hypothetical protein HETIRDRAFT_108448 [Heterobasidion irregulare TC 32-1]
MGSVSTSSISTAGAISEDAGALSASLSSEGKGNGKSDFGEDGGQERSTGANDNSTEGGDEGDEVEVEEGEDKADRIKSNNSSSFDPTLGDGEDEEEGDEGERVVFELVLDTPAPAGYKKERMELTREEHDEAKKLENERKEGRELHGEGDSTNESDVGRSAIQQEWTTSWRTSERTKEHEQLSREVHRPGHAVRALYSPEIFAPHFEAERRQPTKVLTSQASTSHAPAKGKSKGKQIWTLAPLRAHLATVHLHTIARRRDWAHAGRLGRERDGTS